VLDSASDASRAFKALAGLYLDGHEAPVPEPEAQPPRKSLFRLGGRRS
jgi:hypothetical protein